MKIPAMIKTRANTPRPAPTAIAIALFDSGKGVATKRNSFYLEIFMLNGYIELNCSWNTFCINHKIEKTHYIHELFHSQT